MQTFVVLAMHGSPPNDFPGRELGEYFALGHSEDEIPQAIEAARRKHPGVSFHYAWPIGEPEVARFLADQIRATLAEG